jgi:hypothetical protein
VALQGPLRCNLIKTRQHFVQSSLKDEEKELILPERAGGRGVTGAVLSKEKEATLH